MFDNLFPVYDTPSSLGIIMPKIIYRKLRLPLAAQSITDNDPRIQPITQNTRKLSYTLKIFRLVLLVVPTFLSNLVFCFLSSPFGRVTFYTMHLYV